MSKAVFETLGRIPQSTSDPHIFLYWGQKITWNFAASIVCACRKAGVTWGREEKGGFVFHGLRHTFITDMRRAGVPRTVTMAITGHAIIDMNERYDVVEDWEKAEAIKKLEAFRAASVDQTVDQAHLKSL